MVKRRNKRPADRRAYGAMVLFDRPIEGEDLLGLMQALIRIKGIRSVKLTNPCTLDAENCIRENERQRLGDQIAKLAGTLRRGDFPDTTVKPDL